MQSSFEEILYLDTDNMPIADPSWVFESKAYRQHGALFWPDLCNLFSVRDSAWEIFSLPRPYESVTIPKGEQIFVATQCVHGLTPEMQAGEVVLHKRKAWKVCNSYPWIDLWPCAWMSKYGSWLTCIDTRILLPTTLHCNHLIRSHLIVHTGTLDDDLLPSSKQVLWNDILRRKAILGNRIQLHTDTISHCDQAFCSYWSCLVRFVHIVILRWHWHAHEIVTML